MSPHAVPQQQDWDELLASFNVTKHGFLPAEEPLKSLPDAYYEPWEYLICNLQPLLAERTLRQSIDTLPVLSVDKLHTEPEWRRAYVILTLLTHSYVWGGDNAAEILPPPIAVPLLSVSSHLQVPPVATYAALNLWNFASSTGDFTDVDSLHSPHTFTGTRDESWFLCVSVAMEAQGARVLPSILAALAAVPARDYATITAALDQLAACIHAASALLARMRDHCDPMVFYHLIRPFLAGSKNMAAAGLPRGLYYDQGDHGAPSSWQQWRGGSNGQSSLIQLWDVVLGVTHTSDGDAKGNPHAGTASAAGKPTEDKSFHDEVREYMPGGHRRLLEYVGRCGSIRALAMQPVHGADPDHARMQAAYTNAIRALTEFRNGHLAIITSYIVVPSKKPWLGAGSGLDGGKQDDTADRELTGTGGTALLPFLKQSRDETKVCGELVKARMAEVRC
ncbi:indoleamine 2,3-dioxygenase [Coniella lustricola]|uniref:Indoleamine 2,3-dioxygenase n=1 Tax=Coniella lustricola TaxID=2025994 RepID=A0A2T2ZVJ7_9PEZI|nr:indoleamine 2,3-dioxygenase [Coniella lustricola]